VLGGGQEAHALLAGRTGSGKTNLMHVIITTLALTYSPNELELYLIDFKGGVGFKRYADHRLPHAKVIAIESEREFGMSVLKRLDEELTTRSKAFKSAGTNVGDLAAYRDTHNDGPFLPRILLIVDEYQEFFTQDDLIATEAKLILERLARQGRSYGLHFLLATQSLTGAAQLPEAIISQMKVRIALPCNDVDSRLIFSEENKAARSLSQAGEGIYNPMGGMLEGNNPFQVARFDEKKDLEKYLTRITESAQRHGFKSAPRIFEGNELARFEECEPLVALLKAGFPAEPVSRSPQVWIGEAIDIQPSLSFKLGRQAGANILVVSREEEMGVSFCLSAQLSLLAQHPSNGVSIYNFDITTADAPWAECAEEIRDWYGEDYIKVFGRRDAEEALTEVYTEMRRRLKSDGTDGMKPMLLVFQGLHRIRDLRGDGGYFADLEEGSPRAMLADLLKEGPEVGIHTIVWADTLANAKRSLDDRAMREFDFRISGPLSQEDSQDLLEAPDASRINKPNRFLLFEEERPGVLTLFRPYSIPDAKWLTAIVTPKTNP